MFKSRVLPILAAAVLLTMPVMASVPGNELWIPAAGLTQGAAGSFWVTDLHISNLGEDPVDVELTWLERGADNSEAQSVPLTLAAGETVALENVASSVFGRAEATGAIRITAEEAREDQLIANARIYNLDEGATYGQGIEALSSRATISAGGNAVTHVIGVGENDGFRTNWFGLNLSRDSEGEPAAGEVLIEMLDQNGEVIASKSYSMPPLSPMLHPISDIGSGSSGAAALRFTMIDGTGTFAASRIDPLSNDPTTLTSHWDPDACGGASGESVEIEEGRLYVEYNATDGDLGVHGSFEHDGWVQLCVFDPDGRAIASFRPKGETARLGFADIFFESEEPELDEFSFQDLRESFPEGDYTVRGVTVDGEALTGAALFTHDVPAAPVITSPAGMVEDPEDEEPPAIPMQNLVVSWLPVTATVDGEPVTITGYQVIVTDEEFEDPHGLSKPVYDVRVRPGTTSVPVPIEFLTEDTVYEVEVLALEESGNQTISLGFFRTP